MTFDEYKIFRSGEELKIYLNKDEQLTNHFIKYLPNEQLFSGRFYEFFFTTYCSLPTKEAYRHFFTLFATVKNRRYFSIHRRGVRVTLNLKYAKEPVETSLNQARFVLWLISNEEILEAMNEARMDITRTRYNMRRNFYQLKQITEDIHLNIDN